MARNQGVEAMTLVRTDRSLLSWLESSIITTLTSGKKWQTPKTGIFHAFVRVLSRQPSFPTKASSQIVTFSLHYPLETALMARWLTLRV